MKIRIFNWWNNTGEKPTWFRLQYWKAGPVFADGDTLQLVLFNVEFQLQITKK